MFSVKSFSQFIRKWAKRENTFHPQSWIYMNMLAHITNIYMLLYCVGKLVYAFVNSH